VGPEIPAMSELLDLPELLIFQPPELVISSLVTLHLLVTLVTPLRIQLEIQICRSDPPTMTEVFERRKVLTSDLPRGRRALQCDP
jgi:hypothetical protein